MNPLPVDAYLAITLITENVGGGGSKIRMMYRLVANADHLSNNLSMSMVIPLHCGPKWPLNQNESK